MHVYNFFFSVTILAPAFFNLSQETPGDIKVVNISRYFLFLSITNCRLQLQDFSRAKPISLYTPVLHLVDYRIVFPKSQAYVLYGLLWNLGTKATARDESGLKVKNLWHLHILMFVC